jgi:4-amino-4-deoxychorismate lyase
MVFPRYKHFGEGLFETFKVENGKLPPYFAYHYERLKQGAEFFKIPYPTFEEFKNFVEKQLKEFKNFSKPLYVKVLLLSVGEGYFGGKATDYRLEAVIKPLKLPEGALTLTISPYRRHSQNPIWRFKTLNFLFNISVKREAASRGYYDALILNEKERITETSSANFYCLKDGILLTPPVEDGLLPGITRRVLLEKGKAVERTLTIEDLKKCEKFFISNSLLGLREVELDL